MMPITTDTEYTHIGETSGCENHVHDLIHELSRRLDGLWRYDQYISNADEHQELQEFWRQVKSQEQSNIKQIKQLLTQQIENKCF